MSTPYFVRHLNGQGENRFPVWMMRQAGRYLESYREIRKDHGFWEMASTPELTEKVSLLPIDVLNVDAVIFFSDILTLPYGLKFPTRMEEGRGPVTEPPLRKLEDFAPFAEYISSLHTPFVTEALKGIRSKLDDEKALLGFAGAPWTVGTYLVEGHGSRQWENTKKWLFQDPDSFWDSISLLSDATFKYLKSQLDAGADAVQIFDSWVGSLSTRTFKEHYLPILGELCTRLQTLGKPIIYFAKDASHLLPLITELPVQMLSIDPSISLKEAEKLTNAQFSLQGNLDPVLLLTDPETIRRETQALVEEARSLKHPAILNLGHGILRTTPVEHAQIFVDEARREWT